MHTQLSKGILMVKDNIIPNHMDIYWHDYTGHVKDKPITEASVPVKAALIGRVGLMLLSCGTGAWRVRSSMNAISEQLGVTCTSSIGLMTIVYTCFDGHKTFTNSLCLNNTGVNTSKLNRLERFVKKFPTEGVHKSGEQLHQELDEIEKIRGLYTPAKLGLAAAFACAAFTFLLGGGPIEMLCAFIGAGAGNFLRSKLIGKHYTLYLCVVSSVALACLAYVASLRLIELAFPVAGGHEVGYICAMLFIIPGFPFITSGIDLAKLDMRSGTACICGDHRCHLNNYGMGHVTDTEPVTGSFCGSGAVAGTALRASADCKLCRGLWILYNVQQSGFHCSLSSRHRRSCKYAETGACRSGRASRSSCRFYRSTDSRTSGLAYDEKTGIPENIRNRTVHRHHGSRSVSVPGCL